MVLGENIGTTFTAIIASLVANTPAKRAAMAHLLFNLIGVAGALILFRPFILGVDYLVMQIDHVSAFNSYLTIPLALSIFHTVFNLVNTLILINFIPFLILLTRKIIPGRDEDKVPYRLKYIDSTVLSTSELSLLQARKEVKHLALKARQMFDIIPIMLMEKRSKKYEQLYEIISKNEEMVDEMEIEIAKYLTSLSDGKLSDRSNRQVRALLKIIDDLESIGDRCNSMAGIIDAKNQQNAYFTQDLRDNLNELFAAVEHAFGLMLSNLEGSLHLIRLREAKEAEEKINMLRNRIREEHILNINAGKYPYQTGTYYSELFTLSEKIGDYIINVSEALAEVEGRD
ncbi:MAG: PhoU domain-containing protein [Bacteroidota bacterium]|nr:PhoU domain-containing protein [Bacteroidota bacterium]